MIAVHIAYCFNKARFGITCSHKNANDDQRDRENLKNSSENHTITYRSTNHGRHKQSSKCRQQHQDEVRGRTCPGITAARRRLGFRWRNDMSLQYQLLRLTYDIWRDWGGGVVCLSHKRHEADCPSSHPNMYGCINDYSLLLPGCSNFSFATVMHISCLMQSYCPIMA